MNSYYNKLSLSSFHSEFPIDDTEEWRINDFVRMECIEKLVWKLNETHIRYKLEPMELFV